MSELNLGFLGQNTPEELDRQREIASRATLKSHFGLLADRLESDPNADLRQAIIELVRHMDRVYINRLY